MTSHAANEASAIDALDALRREVAQLSDRISALEAEIAPSLTVAQKASDSATALESNEELIAVVSAAVAAFLGVKPRIRQISLMGGATWAQQGRVTIQASHALSVRHE